MVMRYEGLKEKLDKEYLLVFEKIELYTQMHHINEKKQAESLMDLMDVFLESQTNKKDINDIIGEDIETFCENYFSEYGAKERVIDILLYFKRLVLVVFVLELFFLIEDLQIITFIFGQAKQT